jgi:hypothetical protein
MDPCIPDRPRHECTDCARHTIPQSVVNYRPLHMVVIDASTLLFVGQCPMYVPSIIRSTHKVRPAQADRVS